MKKSLPLIIIILLLFSINSNAQHFTQTTAYDTIQPSGDTLYFPFTGAPGNVWGQAGLTVYYAGEFGDVTDYLSAFGPGMVPLGQTGPHSSAIDCNAEDSALIIIDSAYIELWGPDFFITVITTPDVDSICPDNR